MDSQFNTDLNLSEQPQRPEFLKILCILSFVGLGIMIIFSFLMMLCLAIDDSKINEVWDEAIKANPMLENFDPSKLLKGVGMLGALTLIANLVSPMGVIQMWKLEMKGLIVYAVAEIAANFLSLFIDLGMPQEQKSSVAGIIFWIVIDSLFILAYYHNLKKINSNPLQ
ncbi:MAG: hypothetical protein IM600_03450 [Bacteroidetes bacterium]|nr:hypothetical protein [Bacteroidota bacterium]